MRLSQHHRQWLYAVGGCLVGSGVGWLIAHYMLGGADSFGETRHPSEPWWLRLHGAAVMAFLVVFGTILPGHVTRAWSLRKNRAQSVRRNVVTGTLMLSLVAALALTGYALYYFGSEELRPYISAGHWVLGLAATVGFYQHRRGRLQRWYQPDRAKQAERLRAREPSPGGVMLKHHPRRHL
jgi:H+/Cl- antiporter ClcA